MSDNLVTLYVDRCVDEINAFHRDERKAQVKTMRTLAKKDAFLVLEAMNKVGVEDTDFLVDKAREFGRRFLSEEYSDAIVERNQLGR